MNIIELTPRETIIEATKEILKEKGNVTIKDIAARAYVNIAAINYYFGSKDNLIQIVIEESVSVLRSKILATIIEEDFSNLPFEESMMKLINVIFTFAEDNMGIINYSFLQIATQSESANVLVDFFLTDEEFTGVIFEQLSANFPEYSHDQLFAKYLILFSSFVVPFFLNFSMCNTEFLARSGKNKISFFERYKSHYIEELKKFLIP